MTEENSESKWSWSQITVGALSVVSLLIGLTLLSRTPEGTTEGGAMMLALGCILAGSWLVITIHRDMKSK